MCSWVCASSSLFLFEAEKSFRSFMPLKTWVLGQAPILCCLKELRLEHTHEQQGILAIKRYMEAPRASLVAVCVMAAQNANPLQVFGGEVQSEQLESQAG